MPVASARPYRENPEGPRQSNQNPRAPGQRARGGGCSQHRECQSPRGNLHPQAACFGERERSGAGTSNTNLGATKYEFGGMYFAFFTVNTAKYSPKYFRICKYGPYLAFLSPGSWRHAVPNPRGGLTDSDRKDKTQVARSARRRVGRTPLRRAACALPA